MILASQSPRRKEILEHAGFSFAVHAAEIDETPLDRETPPQMVERLARTKGHATVPFARKLGDDLIIAADTIVWTPDLGMLGKPADAQDALRMLTLLSGRTHSVTTGVSIIRIVGTATREHTFHETTEVSFHMLDDAQLRAYVASGEPLDKAGAYAIQGRGAVLVRSIRGDYGNVVGLPLSRLVHELDVVYDGTHDFVLDALGG
ncbi:septum formation protein Maf [Coriobacteriales bacterium OH1046]|nr:septum formation protein Maf [Coriobacteriales bacterium OH1046]